MKKILLVIAVLLLLIAVTIGAVLYHRKGKTPMKSLKIARFFYAPICPEAYATAHRLQVFFQGVEDCHYESFDLVQDQLVSPYPWFAQEQELLKTWKGESDQPFLYGTLFIEGEVVKGFPPSPKHLEEILKRNQLRFNPDKYPFSYNSQNISEGKADTRTIEPGQFTVTAYNPSNMKTVCQLCSLHHPYLNPKDYQPEYWEVFEKKKESYLQKTFSRQELIGFVATYNEEPAGFIEAFPIELAAKMGFPTSDDDDKGVMITCLSVRSENSGFGLASQLIQNLEQEICATQYEYIEVLAFPDEHKWQPKSLYEKNGYRIVKPINHFFLVKKRVK